MVKSVAGVLIWALANINHYVIRCAEKGFIQEYHSSVMEYVISQYYLVLQLIFILFVTLSYVLARNCTEYSTQALRAKPPALSIW